MSMEFDRKWGPDFIRAVPEAPGIYIFRDATAAVIYVGKAKHLRRRLAQYRLASTKKNQRKMRLIVRKASALEFQVCATETDALLLENQLIQTHRPLFNIVGAYAFLYPYLGIRVSPTAPRELALCYTTQAEILQDKGFQLFGAFRSRDVVTAAFDALAELLAFISHNDPTQRASFGSIPYTRIVCFRQLDPEWTGLLTELFRGESGTALQRLFSDLLEKPGARRHAEAVQGHLRQLRSFFTSEAARLRSALRQHGRDEGMIAQEERDALFLALQALESLSCSAAGQSQVAEITIFDKNIRK